MNLKETLNKPVLTVADLICIALTVAAEYVMFLAEDKEAK